MIPLNGDQRRELINSRQRYEAFRAASQQFAHYRGSMVWSKTKDVDYLLRSFYPGGSKLRKQSSLGPRTAVTETIKADFDEGREAARRRRDAAAEALERQSAMNRALGLGRVPLLSARIVRALDQAGLLGSALKIAGTHAIFAYESAAGVQLDPEITTTEDIDLLFDARARISLLETGPGPTPSLIGILKRIDRSFARTRETFRAANDETFLVDLIKPMPKPPWKVEPTKIGDASDELEAVEIAGLEWLANAPVFEAVVMDQRGAPLRMVTLDPRAFAIHKHWLSARPDRDPVKRVRDAAQARSVAKIVVGYFQHLPFDATALRMIPKRVVEAARPLFVA